MDVKSAGEMQELLELMLEDLEKAKRGNKTAAQRVRVLSVTLSKVAKEFRKESIALEKKQGK